ncbi:hypothetical protein SAMN04488043_11625 [Thalassovita gelatinovora]|uniref:hypothetical protein n=1 Tax=Thalassovita gelatinovora TaxID=53501 RepID=UPI0008BDD6FE|nr:hypothetical protein [Thalassovita gelatinovora]QIZ82671.1 hypothetical protein HFZ77_19055 [Thalassovita gelatinovora]SER11361.1 hypothetical protein SAMN04488043_11625 [Thalassovita gelatinovora]
MRKTAENTGLDPSSETKEADFSFVLSGELSAYAPVLLALAETAFPDLEIAWRNSLQDSLKHKQTGPLIVPLTPPIGALAQRLLDGQKPADALDDWTGTTQSHLNSYRSARRQVKLLALGPLLAGAADSWAALAAQIGQPAPAPLAAQAPNDQAQSHEDNLSHLVAAYLLQSVPAAQALASEIEAMIHGPLPFVDAPLRGAEAVLEQARAQQDRVDALTTERDLLRENLDATLTSLTQAQAQLDQGTKDRDQLLQARQAQDDKLQQQGAALDSARKTAADADQANQALGTQNALLRENLALLVAETDKQASQQRTLATELKSRTELEARLSKTSGTLVQAEATVRQQAQRIAQLEAGLRQAGQDTAQTRQALHSLQQQHEQLGRDASLASETLDQVLRSTSWKLSSPLRKVVSRLRSH